MEVVLVGHMIIQITFTLYRTYFLAVVKLLLIQNKYLLIDCLYGQWQVCPILFLEILLRSNPAEDLNFVLDQV